MWLLVLVSSTQYLSENVDQVEETGRAAAVTAARCDSSIEKCNLLSITDLMYFSAYLTTAAVKMSGGVVVKFLFRSFEVSSLTTLPK